jgi:hypothetical protein
MAEIEVRPACAGRKQPNKLAEFEIKITVEILAQEKDTETHSSREGIYGSHRRLLKRMNLVAIVMTPRAYQKSRLITGK